MPPAAAPRDEEGRWRGSFTDRAGRRRSKTGWEFVDIAIDDATRLAYAEVLTDETARTAVGFCAARWRSTPATGSL